MTTLLDAAHAWAAQLNDQGPWTLRKLISDAGCLLDAEGLHNPVLTADDARSKVWLRLDTRTGGASIVVHAEDAWSDVWIEVPAEVPDRVSRVWHLTDLAERMGDLATDADAAELRGLLIADGWMEWTSDRDGGWLIAVPDDTWLGLVETACARTAE